MTDDNVGHERRQNVCISIECGMHLNQDFFFVFQLSMFDCVSLIDYCAQFAFLEMHFIWRVQICCLYACRKGKQTHAGKDQRSQRVTKGQVQSKRGRRRIEEKVRTFSAELGK